jgi:DNA-binding response OmpR family regulator
MSVANSDEAASNDRPVLVLVIDRDEHARFIYRSVLQHAGFDVITATDGDSGL